MEAITLSTDLHCDSCVSKVNPILKEELSIQQYDINLDHPEKLVTIKGTRLNSELLISKFGDIGFQAEIFNEPSRFKFQR